MPPKGSSSTPKSGVWDKTDFLNDLLVAFYQAGSYTNTFNPQINNAIVEFLTSRGYDTSWSAIRPQVHEDILVAMFYNMSLSSEQWTKIMADLSEMGYTFSESALRYVFGPMAFHLDNKDQSAFNTLGTCASPCQLGGEEKA
ncbi:hypothetical protein GGI43DRAFT_378373 [Trichoderma evansii]